MLQNLTLLIINFLICLINGVGKFGQKSHPLAFSILSTHSSEKNVEEVLERLVHFEPLFDKKGENDAVLLEYTAKSPHPNYPIYLSAQILAYSRVYMSCIYRACGAYLNPRNAIYYTDTDSMVLSRSAYEELKNAKVYLGAGLGQMSCDLFDNTQNKFAKIIRGIWGAPKGMDNL